MEPKRVAGRQTESLPAARVLPPVGAPSGSKVERILALQRLAGNRVVSRLLQAKSTVGRAEDASEEEADRTADAVMGFLAGADVGSLTAELGDTPVRIHDEAGDNRLSRSVQARAFATSRNIFLSSGHELTDVAQQEVPSRLGRSLIGRGAITVEREASPNLSGDLTIRPSGGTTSLVQRKPITVEASLQALKQRAPAFFEVPHTIITPLDDDGQFNCHGYTLDGADGEFVDGSEFLKYYKSPLRVVVFVRGGEIAHSGRLNDDETLTHLLIGVGVLTSTIADKDMGYESRYSLPEDLEALETYLRPKREAREDEDRIRKMVHVMGNAVNEKMEGAQELLTRVEFLQDYPDTDKRADITADYTRFVEEHPGLLEESEDDYSGYY